MSSASFRNHKVKRQQKFYAGEHRSVVTWREETGDEGVFGERTKNVLLLYFYLFSVDVRVSTCACLHIARALRWLHKKCFTLAPGVFSGLRTNVPSGTVCLEILHPGHTCA